ncbi:MAG: hypothetical protein H6721_32175 [Sandaracinus sp.]|nr:hypothetical protein [Sandaracinus sp.]MCB9617337.1 hypothetical protein [Sandaracinus sp.]MCB9633775.1 hypothetical protein [Sandaracinus sp.]MCB9636792.1 hypothetical protein [Sandaracinus sp.]
MSQEKQRIHDIRRRLEQIKLERARQDREFADLIDSSEIDVVAMRDAEAWAAEALVSARAITPNQPPRLGLAG